ncbi:methyltransferase domain-containing protein [Candidatus Saccharibacteria bacterium]|nr:methyltransferase domain-containing protein [Candidatus Saccharibacteria bacterium]MCB9821746.1 methyltransferase domain-containing protein [Candidatus Nomurabacteria bacterium]
MYTYLLVPGRHHLLSNFMHDYFLQASNNRSIELIDGSQAEFDESICMVWAITSANHQNTRRNPLAGYRREAAVDEFMADLPCQYLTYHINDIGQSNRFADYIIKSIEVESRGSTLLTPDNTIVATSTPSVIELFETLGYKIAPIELSSRQPEQYRAARAWDILLELVAAGNNWRDSESYIQQMHPSSQRLLDRYKLAEQIIELHNDPLVGDEGDITETRDYEKYRQSFDTGAERKYAILGPHIRPGRIIDIGCATGSLLKQIDNDDRFRESDLYGIEVAKPLYDRCLQRLANGEFRNENTFFYQRNIMRGKLFPDNSVNTSISISLTHEIDSYLGRDSLHKFISQIFQQTAPGGVYINLDVTCPENPDEKVVIWLNHLDGQDADDQEYAIDRQTDYSEYLGKLSTLGLFKRFIKDFRKTEGDQIKDYELFEKDEQYFARLRRADAVEFMVTKDYQDSWYSEMHERFCYWPPSEWQRQLEAVGFSVDPASGAFQNDWINQNRFEGKLKLFIEIDGQLVPQDWPDTSVLMVARKP